MENEVSLCDIDSLLFQLLLQTRFLSQKKNEVNQEIKVCRDDIAERRSYIETTQKNIKKLDDEIRVLQNAAKQKKENAKSVKVTNSLLLQYEQTLKAELDKRKESYNHDMKEYEERIASCRKTFQEHKEYYSQNPLAQKFLMIQAEEEEIESRIKACDDQITMKQKELDKLNGQAAISNSTEKAPDSVSSQRPVNEPMQQFDNQAEDSYSDIYLHVSQLKDGHQLSEDKSVYEIHEDFNIHDTPASCPTEETNHELQSSQQLHEQDQSEPMQTEEQDHGLEQEGDQSTLLGTQAEEKEMKDGDVLEEENAPFFTNEEDDEDITALPQSSPSGASAQTAIGMKTAPSTPTFPFNFSPGSSSSCQGTSGTKSPAFLFSVNSNPNTPGFSGFGFDMGSSQEEDSAFPFTGSFFNDKKTGESKSPTGPEFLFNQPDQTEGFQFCFSAKSPKTSTADKDKSSGDEFPFSFNF